MDLFNWLENNATRLSNEDIANIAELTSVKEIYSCWESYEDGEDVTLYTGLAVDGVARRYFIDHFIREWYGGWTCNDIHIWYEISEQDYLQLCASTEK